MHALAIAEGETLIQTLSGNVTTIMTSLATVCSGIVSNELTALSLLASFS